MYKALQVEIMSKQNANYASNNWMYRKRNKVRINLFTPKGSPFDK